MSRKVSSTQESFVFGTGFMQDHAGQIVTDPRVAAVELVANAYDAGASEVHIQWPNAAGEVLSVVDNGCGMTRQQFEKRWKTLLYNRTKEQGAQVEFPPSVAGARRTAFGHNGKGRFSPFCFADEYRVETWRDGKFVRSVVRIAENSAVPFLCKVEEEGKRQGTGTSVSCVAVRNILTSHHIREVIGFKFGVVPTFQVRVNGVPVQLFDLDRGIATYSVEVDGVGNVLVHRLDPKMQERTILLKGIVWWINRRMVGEPSWDGLDEAGKYLDGRTSEAKRFSYVVEANCLTSNDTKTDWSGFLDTPRVTAVKAAVHTQVVEDLKALLSGDRKAVKKDALKQNQWLIRDLPRVSQRQISTFLDEVQEKCPTLGVRELSKTVEIWGKLEQSRSGYDLLAQLARCSPDDMDKWNSIMQSWTATSAEVVLSEIQRRLTVINQLQEIVLKNCDEVHDLQPLFERGLWIFGPEYESIEFTSNRAMVHVVREFFRRDGIEASLLRPDFVALPDSSIGLYAADEHLNGEVSGVRKILIVELKKGGFQIGQKQLAQALGYALELRSTGCAQATTTIEGFVLGATLAEGLEPLKSGERDGIIIRPRLYDAVLRQAHARLFNLAKRIKETAIAQPDSDIDAVLGEQIPELFTTPQQSTARRAAAAANSKDS